MAGKVKKGFGTYMFILFLMLIAAFLITVMVMIFNPFKNVVGYQYLFYKDVHSETNVTGGGTNAIFDLGSMDEIKINCNYADVAVYRSNMVQTNQIKIENTVNGFAKADGNVEFSYQIYYEKGSNNKVLCVDVKEAEGFLFLTKSVTVSIVLPTHGDYNLSNTKLNITNNSGSVYIGSGDAGSATINIKSLDIKTKSGNIFLSGKLGSQMQDIFISSERGEIESGINLEATNSFSLNSVYGKLQFKNIKSNNTASMILGNSQFSANQITGNVDIEIDDGYFNVEKLDGDISGNDAAEQMTTSTINIKEVDGNVSFPFANAAKINIAKINNGNAFIHGTTGSVVIGALSGYGWITMTSGSVDVALSGACEIVTTTGNINVKYTENTLSQALTIQSQSGNVSLGVNTTLPFVLNVYNDKGELRDHNKVDVEGFDSAFTIPLVINGGSTGINVSTNGAVSVSINKADN